jgi:hypothetical protein
MKNYNNNERSNIEASTTTRSCERDVNSAELNELNQKGSEEAVAQTKKEGTEQQEQQPAEFAEPKRLT